MKINFVIPSIVLGGGVRVVFIYANELVKRGHDVVVYLPMIFSWKDINNGAVNWHTSFGNTIKRKSYVSWIECNFPIKRVPLINDTFVRDADVTIATAWYTARNVSLLSTSKGKKVYFIQDYEVSEDLKNKGKVEESYLCIKNRITIASWLDKLVSNITGEKTFVLLNGVVDDEYIKGEKRKSERKTIIMLGNMAPHKGGKTGVRVLKRIKEKYDVDVIVYAATRSDIIPSSFEFYCQPSRDKLMELYSRTDICLFPSVREGWGLIVTEAMAHKCAVVGNPTGALDEIGIDGVNALFSDGASEEALYQSLERVLNDEKLLVSLQDNGFETVRMLKFSLQCEKLEKYLMSISDGEKYD